MFYLLYIFNLRADLYFCDHTSASSRSRQQAQMLALVSTFILAYNVQQGAMAHKPNQNLQKREKQKKRAKKKSCVLDYKPNQFLSKAFLKCFHLSTVLVHEFIKYLDYCSNPQFQQSDALECFKMEMLCYMLHLYLEENRK